jgi:hypothetical protein
MLRKMKLTLTILTCLTLTLAPGQNLVPNSDFEMAIGCPNCTYQMTNCSDWLTFGGTPDYLNSCFPSSSLCNAPSSRWGFQNPHSGNGMSAIINWYNQISNYREQLGVQLTSPLIIGQKYYLSFYINYSGYSSPWVNIASNKIGILFSTVYETPTGTASAWTNNFAHFKTNIIYKDTLNWLKISGSIIADSSYTYMAIGNFFDDAHTDTSLIAGISSGPIYSAYFIDDVCVSTDSLTCSSVTTDLMYYQKNLNLKIFPNPTSDESILQFDNAKKEKCTLTLYDLRGQIKRTINNITSDQVVIQKKDLPNGLYYFSLRTVDRVIVTGKLSFE